MTLTAQKGDKVLIDYDGTLEDGTLVDTTKAKGAVEFVIGADNILPGLEKAVIGMNRGETKSVRLEPEEAFGPVKEELIVHDIPKAELHENIQPAKGLILQWDLPNGQKMSVQIIDVKEDTVSFDGNHLLAGQAIYFDITLLDFERCE